MKKRSRACEACQKLKAKCIFSDPARQNRCDKCHRAEIECVPAAPRFQRDRIAELEDQIRQLSATPTSTVTDSSGSLRDFIDARMSHDAQRAALAGFAAKLEAWPIMDTDDVMDWGRLRSEDDEEPSGQLLLLVILAFPADTRLPADVQSELVTKAMAAIGEQVLGKGRRSLTMIKALLVAAFWTRQTQNLSLGHCHQLVQLAVDMAVDTGIAGPHLIRSPPTYFSPVEDAQSLEAMRTWIACFIAASVRSHSIRRPPSILWTPHLEECARYLDGTDAGLLAQIARLMNICNEAAAQLGLCDLATYLTVEKASGRMANLRHLVSTWEAQVPPNLTRHPVLGLWRHIALVFIHEVVLHTPTNKASFAGPYVPSRIAVSDFASPGELTPLVIDTLQRLILACHGVSSQAINMDPSTMLGAAYLAMGPAILHTNFILAHAHVAVTAMGNALGRVASPEDVGLSANLDKLERVSLALSAADPAHVCFTTTVMKSTGWIRTWLNDYHAIVQRFETDVAN